jgi:hypothetical protein
MCRVGCRLLSLQFLHPGQWLDLPVPIQPEYPVEILVTPSPPSDARLTPSLPPSQQCADFHLHIAVHFTKGTIGVADSEVVYPSSERSVDLRHHLRHRGFPSTSDDVAYLCLDRFAGFLLRAHEEKISVSTAFPDTTQIESQEPKGFACQCVYHLGFLLVQFHTKRCELFLEPLQGAFSPTSFGMVSTDGDDDIIGEPMIVHCLVGSLRSLTAYRVEGPVQFV